MAVLSALGNKLKRPNADVSRLDARDTKVAQGKQHAVNEPRVADAAPAYRLESSVYDTSVYDNSVYDKDETTVKLVSTYARRWRASAEA